MFAAYGLLEWYANDAPGIKLDDPSFLAPIYATLVEAEDGTTYNLIWSRRNGD